MLKLQVMAQYSIIFCFILREHLSKFALLNRLGKSTCATNYCSWQNSSFKNFLFLQFWFLGRVCVGALEIMTMKVNKDQCSGSLNCLLGNSYIWLIWLIRFQIRIKNWHSQHPTNICVTSSGEIAKVWKYDRHLVIDTIWLPTVIYQKYLVTENAKMTSTYIYVICLVFVEEDTGVAASGPTMTGPVTVSFTRITTTEHTPPTNPNQNPPYSPQKSSVRSVSFVMLL